MHEELKQLIRANPFVPFRIYMKSGKVYELGRPGLAGTHKNHFLLNDDGIGRRFSYDQIDRLERLQAQTTDTK